MDGLRRRVRHGCLPSRGACPGRGAAVSEARAQTRPCRLAVIARWEMPASAQRPRVGPAGAIPGKLARFVPTSLTDAAETPRKNLRLDRHGDPWAAVHPVRLLRHGAVPVPAEPYVLGQGRRSEEHTYELQSLMRISNAVFCLQKKYT